MDKSGRIYSMDKSGNLNIPKTILEVYVYHGPV